MTGDEPVSPPSSLLPLLGERPAAASPSDGEDFKMTGDESFLLRLPLLSLLGERPAAASPSDGEDFQDDRRGIAPTSSSSAVSPR